MRIGEKARHDCTSTVRYGTVQYSVLAPPREGPQHTSNIICNSYNTLIHVDDMKTLQPSVIALNSPLDSSQHQARSTHILFYGIY